MLLSLCMANTKGYFGGLSNPSATYDQVVLVEHDGLSRCDGALGIVEGDQGLAVLQRLDGGRRGLMAMANFGVDSEANRVIR